MNTPNFIDVPIAEKDGRLTDSWRQLLSQMITEMQTKMSHEGIFVPQQTTTNIAILDNVKSTGALIYDSNTHKLKANINGVFKEFSFITSPASFPSVTITGLTANRAVVSNSSLEMVSSVTTDTELSYLSGVTSAVQTQLNGKEPTITAGTSAQYWRGNKSWGSVDTLAAANSVVLRDAAAGASLNLNDSAVTPKVSVDAALRTLNNTLGAKILDWNGADLLILDNSGNTKVTVERSTGRVKMVGLVLNNEATLSKYNSQKLNVSFSGIWASVILKELQFSIIGSVVTIVFPETLATAITASYISATLPSPYYPGSTLYFFIPRTLDNGTSASAPSLLTIDSHGALKIYNGVGNFTGSGSSGFRAFSITFSNS